MEFILNLMSWFKNLPAMGKVSLFLVIMGAVVAGVLLHSQVKYSGYQYLYTNLSINDTNDIASRLQSSGIEAQIRGDSILVPANRVLELRNQLASEGLPSGGGTGFEIFDQKNFGASEFEKRINYVRAVQGELARTITAIDGVEKARVHIVIPEKKLFEDDQAQPTASVALSLLKGRSLDQSQVRGIVHMIVTSVEGLTEANINVIDQHGNVLFKATGDDTSNLSSKYMEMQKGLEANMESRISAMLERVVGSGGATVTVSALMDFSQVERTVESFDPESRVAISESEVKENSSGSSGGSAGGAPGAAANLPGGDAGGGGGGNSESSKRSETSTKYAVSKTIQKVLEPIGEVQKLNVAVIVDGTYTADEEGVQTYAPRTEEEMTKITELVQRAVGFDASRGDEVRVENIQFHRLDMTDVSQDAFIEATNSSRMMLFIMDNASFVGAVMILGIIFFLLVRLINANAPPIEMAYANVIGETAGSVAGQLPSGAEVSLVERDAQEAQKKAQEMKDRLPELNQAAKEVDDARLKETQMQLEAQSKTSEEKLRLQAAKIQTEKIVQNNIDDAVQVIRGWMSED